VSLDPKAFEAAGVERIIVRLPSYDQKAQLQHFIQKVAPKL